MCSEQIGKNTVDQSIEQSLDQLDVVIINYNAGQALRAAVDSVLACEKIKTRCVIVDNASNDDSLAFLESYPSSEVLLLRNTENYGFAVAVNQAAVAVQTEFFLLLNPDAVVTDSALFALLRAGQEDPTAGVLSCLVINSDGSEQRGCRRDLPTPLLTLAHGFRLHKLFPGLEFNHTNRALPEKIVSVPALSGACMLIRHAAHQDIGGFDEQFFLHFEDLDYCARLPIAGWQVLFVPYASIQHQQGVSSASRPMRVEFYKARSMQRFLWKHGGKQKIIVPFLVPLIALRALSHIAFLCYQRLSRLLKA